ncbi:hypothetical protein [Neorhizobium galegae]|uniref:Uncharacterized protein n=1 Tax=Neorhizobium galegae bv. officinalis TaxID=323656 RepID=A0A0T7GI98_NEOGA|nr:hypothetical protein [Neorhizobium galegae]CDZ46980.1 Hypothetical protein NGAL_HAMBI1189_16820 [Neorhizobium galegae bv. officinalis]
MKPNNKITKDEGRKKRRADERFRRWLEDRRRQMQREHDRRRKWLLLLLLMMFDSKPVRTFFSSPEPVAVPAKGPPPRKSKKKIAAVETRTDYERHYLFDHAPRRGEERHEVMDGLTYADIIALNKIHRPHLFQRPAPIPGMPDRYKGEAVHIWTLLDHLGSDYHRADAIKALKLLVDESAHDWIDACAKGANGNSWRDLRICRRRTPEMTLCDFPRAAAWWRESVRREEEEKQRTARDTPQDIEKPPGLD